MALETVAMLVARVREHGVHGDWSGWLAVPTVHVRCRAVAWQRLHDRTVNVTFLLSSRSNRTYSCSIQLLEPRRLRL